MFCIDASVLISAAHGNESESHRSQSFLENIHQQKETVFFPEIVIPEMASGITRATGKPDLAAQFTRALREIPNFVFVPVDNQMADLACEVIYRIGVRSADALYIALTWKYNLTLVTLDREQLEKGKEIILTRLP